MRCIFVDGRAARQHSRPRRDHAGQMARGAGDPPHHREPFWQGFRNVQALVICGDFNDYRERSCHRGNDVVEGYTFTPTPEPVSRLNALLAGWVCGQRRRAAPGAGPPDALPYARAEGAASVPARLHPAARRRRSPRRMARPCRTSSGAASHGVRCSRPARKWSASCAPVGIAQRPPIIAWSR